ncbi:MAG: hypothetical protein GXO87_01875, partial [Chlorobi bacterium]|nr:hypothetical protein [Chlorobiota bacterium]
MKKYLKRMAILLAFLPILSFAQGTYYDGIDPTSPSFISDLQNVIRSPFTHISYGQFDETMITQFTAIDNGDGTHSVFCVYTNYEDVYTGTFSWLPMSREHTFCHSWMPTYPSESGNEYSDQHMLFPVNQNNANSPRSNHPLGIVVNPTFTFMEGKLGTDANGNTVYEPRDEFKGNVARALFYAVLMYDGTGGSWAFNDINDHLVNDLNEAPQDVNLLISWHFADPPDDYDIARNDYVQSIQQNRNPFVDHPEYVNYIDFNTLSAGTAAPVITNISRSPAVPYENINAVILCDVTETGKAITSVQLDYTINGGPINTVAMSLTTGNTYMGDIPESAYNDGDFVEYYIHAVSDAGGEANSATFSFFAGVTPMTTLHDVNGLGELTFSGVYARAEGDATVADGAFSSNSLQVYFQDGEAGLNIYKGGSPATFQLGRVYEVTGQLAQYNGLAELVPDNVSIDIIDKGAGATPDPIVLTIAEFLASPESYEGMLVGIQHVANDGTGDPWPASGSNANVTISDGTGTIAMRIDKDTDIDENSEPTWPKDVVGIFNQYDNSSPYTDGYQLLPRSFADFHPDGWLPVELTSFSASVEGVSVTLNWETASELNNKGF